MQLYFEANSERLFNNSLYVRVSFSSVNVIPVTCLVGGLLGCVGAGRRPKSSRVCVLDDCAAVSLLK